MRKKPLSRPVEQALHARLLDAQAEAVRSPTFDLFPAELEAALDSAVKEFRSPERRPAGRSRN